MKTLKKIVLAVIFLVLILLVYVQVFSRDAATVDDADLVLAPVEILSQSDNAYYVLPIIDGRTDRDLTDAFIAASTLPGYQCPTMVNNYSAVAEACLLNDIRNVANLVADRAIVSLSVGNTTDAMESALAIVRVANQLAISNSMLIEELVSIALYDIAADTLEQLEGELSPAQNNQVAETLKQYGPDKITLMNAYRAEYMVSKDLVNQAGVGNPSPYRWQPNKTTNELADWYRLILGAEPESSKKVQKKLERNANISPLVLLQPNSTGKIFLSVILGSTNDITPRYNQLQQRYNDLLMSFTTKS